jgi:hypothetical protein
VGVQPETIDTDGHPLNTAIMQGLGWRADRAGSVREPWEHSASRLTGLNL